MGPSAHHTVYADADYATLRWTAADALRDGKRARCSKAAVDAVHALEQMLVVQLLSRTRRLACRQRTDSVLPTATQGVEERRAAMQAQAELHAAAAKKLAMSQKVGVSPCPEYNVLQILECELCYTDHAQLLWQTNTESPLGTNIRCVQFCETTGPVARRGSQLGLTVSSGPGC